MRVNVFLLVVGLLAATLSGCGGGSAPNGSPVGSSTSGSPGGSTTPATTPATSPGTSPATTPSTTPATGTTPSTSSAPFTGQVSLHWDPVPPANLAGYRVYYSVDSKSFPFTGTGATQGNSPVDVGNQTAATITGLDLYHHTYHFAVTAYNTDGKESGYSNIFSFP